MVLHVKESYWYSLAAALILIDPSLTLKLNPAPIGDRQPGGADADRGGGEVGGSQ